ncbi:ABC transporter ATP-binding protein [candidate division KSB1 bacterium]
MIAVKDLTKLYANGKGVRNLDFRISKGEVFGYLGPNGAGKTTTIRNLLGFLRPDSGSCAIEGFDCWAEADRIQKSLGYVPGEIAFIGSMTGIGFLTLIADMRGTRDRKWMQDLIDRFELDATGRIKRMSKGMKQKLGIITACMHDPKVMVFDEPSAGLDPLMRNVFNEFIMEQKGRGKTILMSSHSFEEIDRTCDRAGIIRDGFLVDVRDVGVLKNEQRRAFTVTFASATDISVLKAEGFELGAVVGTRVEVFMQGSADPLVKTLAKFEIIDLVSRPMTLEQVFMQYYGKGGST